MAAVFKGNDYLPLKFDFEYALFTSSSAIWFSKFTDCRSFKKLEAQPTEPVSLT
jgi:hypothetical protein